jgi:hypothetical protein
VNFNNQGRKTVAYVATENDTVYAIDATNSTCPVLGSNTLRLPGEQATNCSDINDCTIGPTIGILDTPVIEITGTDPTTGTLYAVAEFECPTCGQNGLPVFYHRLWALNLATLASTNGNYTQICALGCGKDPDGSTFSATHYGRPGLLFLDNTKTDSLNANVVYAAFSMIDNITGNPNGWIFAYNGHNLADPSYPLSYDTTPGTSSNPGQRGGIWQGGAGLVSAKDSGGAYDIYFSTGDGDFDLDQQQSPNHDAGDSFVKLHTNLTVLPATPQPYYFTPADQFWRGCNNTQYPNDVDFGSGGVLAIPEATFSPSAYYAVKSDKENYLWVIDRTSPGGYTGAAAI